jgi:predicted  nucleic acid-binding Zn-ribbon protein
VRSLEQEADAAQDRLTALEGRMEEIEKEIEEFEELLKG